MEHLLSSLGAAAADEADRSASEPPSPPAGAVASAQNSPLTTAMIPLQSVSGPEQHRDLPQQFPEIGNRDFLHYLLAEKPAEKIPRVFVNCVFNKDIFSRLKTPLEFNGDIFHQCVFENIRSIAAGSDNLAVTFTKVAFVNCVFKEYAALPAGSVIKNCTFSVMSDQKRLLWLRFRFADLGHNWQSTTFDGSQHGIELRTQGVDLSDINMSRGALKNMVFHDENGKFEHSDFSHAELTRVTFIGSRHELCSLYRISEVNFSDTNMFRFSLTNVIFKKVNFNNAMIKALLLTERVDFTDADFTDYQPGNITLSDLHFHTPGWIDKNLNAFNNTPPGAYLFDNIATINNLLVRIDLAEQLVNKCGSMFQLREELERRPILNLAMINGLWRYAEHSAVIKDFIDRRLPMLQDLVLPRAALADAGLCQFLASALMAMANTAESQVDYQFLAQQLMVAVPSLRAEWYRAEPVKHLFSAVSRALSWENANIMQNAIFWQPQTLRALIIPDREFHQLISLHRIPQVFSHISYHPDGEVSVLPAGQQPLKQTLDQFPALAKLWFTTGDLLQPVIAEMLSADSALRENEKAELQLTKQHWISLLDGSATQRLNLSDHLNSETLRKVLQRFYRGSGGATARHSLIANLHQLMAKGLADRGLADNQQKAIVALILARLLLDLSSSLRCGSQYGPIIAMQRLAAELLGDSRGYWGDLLSEADASSWHQALYKHEIVNFNQADRVLKKLMKFQPAAMTPEESRSINGLITQLYPL